MGPRRLTLLALIVAASACSGTTSDPAPRGEDTIVVASFNFDESEVVAEIYAQALESAGFAIERAPQIGTRELVFPALERGLIDVVPEYAGSAVSFLGDTPSANPATTHDRLRALLRERGIDVLDRAPAQNRNALVMRATMAAARSVRSISDLATRGSDLTLGGPPECPDRPLCLPGLESTYGLRFASFLPLEGGASIAAAAIDRGTVDVGVMFTTDGPLSQDGDLVALADDRRLQPAENVTPLVRHDIIEGLGPMLAAVLDDVSAQLTTDGLRELNVRIDAGATPSAAAEAWLSTHEIASAVDAGADGEPR